MKLQAHVSRKIENKTYVKHVIVIPPEIIKKLGWESGKEIDYRINRKKLVLG